MPYCIRWSNNNNFLILYCCSCFMLYESVSQETDDVCFHPLHFLLILPTFFLFNLLILANIFFFFNFFSSRESFWMMVRISAYRADYRASCPSLSRQSIMRTLLVVMIHHVVRRRLSSFNERLLMFFE